MVGELGARQLPQPLVREKMEEKMVEMRWLLVVVPLPRGLGRGQAPGVRTLPRW